jgi:hypothetical protein
MTILKKDLSMSCLGGDRVANVVMKHFRKTCHFIRITIFMVFFTGLFGNPLANGGYIEDVVMFIQQRSIDRSQLRSPGPDQNFYSYMPNPAERDPTTWYYKTPTNITNTTKAAAVAAHGSNYHVGVELGKLMRPEDGRPFVYSCVTSGPTTAAGVAVGNPNGMGATGASGKFPSTVLLGTPDGKAFGIHLTPTGWIEADYNVLVDYDALGNEIGPTTRKDIPWVKATPERVREAMAHYTLKEKLSFKAAQLTSPVSNYWVGGRSPLPPGAGNALRKAGGVVGTVVTGPLAVEDAYNRHQELVSKFPEKAGVLAQGGACVVQIAEIIPHTVCSAFNLAIGWGDTGSTRKNPYGVNFYRADDRQAVRNTPSDVARSWKNTAAYVLGEVRNEPTREQREASLRLLGLPVEEHHEF